MEVDFKPNCTYGIEYFLFLRLWFYLQSSFLWWLPVALMAEGTQRIRRFLFRHSSCNNISLEVENNQNLEVHIPEVGPSMSKIPILMCG